MLLILLTPWWSEAAASTRRVALVIGNSAYKNTVQLTNPRNDAEAMAATLKRLGFDVVLALDVSQAAMAQPVRDFVGRLRDAEVALLFYAGHGLSFEGENYIVPVDAKAEDAMDIRFGMHSLSTITSEMARSARINIVLLDACRDNPLARSLGRSMSGTSRSASVGRGLARIEQIGRQSFVMMATKEGEVADDGAGGHSPFSQALIDNIESEGLEISDLARRVRKSVREVTKERQEPLAVSSIDDAFYFVQPKGAPVADAPTPSPARDAVSDRERDHRYWASIEGLDSLELLRAYIKRFPSGEYVDIARAKIERLEKGPRVEAKPAMTDKPASPDAAEAAYREAIVDGSEEKLRAFLNAYPDYSRSADLRQMLDERDMWRKAQASDTAASYERYLIAFPKGIYALPARDRIAALTTAAAPVVSRSPAPTPPAAPPVYSSPASFSPSFNCFENRGAAEQAVCGSSRLSQLDVELAQLYNLARGRLSKQQGISLRSTQREWLAQRDSCGVDSSCLENLYLSRIRQLRGLLG